MASYQEWLDDYMKNKGAKDGAEGVLKEFQKDFPNAVNDQQPPTVPKDYWKIQAPDLSQMIANRARGLGGYLATENEAMRSQMANTMNAQGQAAQRQLAAMQAKQGIKGGNAASQQMRLAAQMTQQRNMGEQDLFIKNIAEKQNRLKEWEDLQKAQQYGNIAAQLGGKQLELADIASQRDYAGNIATSNASIAAAQNSGGCCFIFLEARYGNGTMDTVVRRYRNEKMTEKNRRGYYKLSEVLVPLMRKYKPVKWAVRLLMTDPLVSYGKAYYGEGKLGKIFKPVVKFWLGLFDYLGGEHPFIRENGEVV